ncbi:TPA: AAA family ATPase [Clostridioides difficile]|uniref:AAA family ATPase n=1 Tax=Clostridioides difficile TaxID=1496 RepID=UPI0009403A5E|nr:AAA family ATPase [Clostridioides difficile]EGT5050673.1 recombinase RecF [Clostridioides difficile]EGT5490590.1 recombinase RecF [Clostridioides difficile]EGT5525356.1 recombinase RecF [Clostridioides difficile]EGT5560718.1 recombinase RecF [Clostridioides difficile]MBG0056094.1 AAA family ATPase [Clostridioides difficile]
MKAILLKSLNIENFKGIKELHIDFNNITNIFGENATGKTSIFDAFTWVMFDKDSKNRSVFEIKPLDRQNKVIRGLVTTVTAVLEVNNKEIKLTKKYEEKWTRKRGESEATFTKNETTYMINDTPIKKSEYVKEIAEIAEEEQFKLLTNPYFFSNELNWKKAREVILEICGDITIEQIIETKQELTPLITEFEKENNIDKIIKNRKASKNNLSKEKEEIPIRVNECNNSMYNIDFEEIEVQLNAKKADLEAVEDNLLNGTKTNEQILKDKEKIFELKQETQSIKQSASEKGNKKRNELLKEKDELQYNIKNLRNNLVYLERDNELKETLRKRAIEKTTNLRDKWTKKSKETLDLSVIQTECPTCKRPLDLEDIEEKKKEMLDNFNLNKAKELKEIAELGKSKNDDVELFNTEIERLKVDINKTLEEIQGKAVLLDKIKKELENTKSTEIYSTDEEKRLTEISVEIKELEEKINNKDADKNIDGLKENKKKLTGEIELLNKELAKRDINKELLDRKEQLLNKEKELGIELAHQEKILNLCEMFIKTKVSLLESNISSKFKNVTFKLFKEQINGGIEETCEALVDGVPFSNVNTAGQINGGLDIINTLSNHFGVKMPIFIDNRESVNDLIDIDSQVINLIVSNDNPLKIEGVN